MKEALLKLLKSPSYTPLRRNDLVKKLGISESQRPAFRRLLKKMVREAALVRIKSNRYALPSSVDLIVGTLQANEKGFGFVIQEKPQAPDIYISPNNMHTALHGDRVLVRLYEPKPRFDRQKRKEQLLEGKILRIEERKNKEILGTLCKTQQFWYVVPDNHRICRDIYVQKKELKGANLGDKVIVQITSWESVHVNPEGKITEVIGSADTPWIDILSIIRKFDLPHEFPKTFEKELAKIPDTVAAKDLKGRKDFRNDVVVTIDPDDAKDFDDAISLTKLQNGHWLLNIHIADVSHYIHPGSALDQEAFKRGTSIYFPGKVIPMLPEKISNHLCSLKQDEVRLVKSVVAELSSEGIILKQKFYNGVIQSKKRFTYHEVKKIVEDKDTKLRRENKETVPTLENMKELATLLKKRRMQRGSLDLKIPSIKVHVDKNGKVLSLEKESYDIAHTMIEEFMLIANELVASHLSKRGFPVVFRVHAEPDEQHLKDFIALVKSFGFNISPSTTTKKLQAFLESIEDHPDALLINYQLLRSLKKAEYASKNIGHYALALTHYAHFTSPIRRYPDLLVHRILSQNLNARSPRYEINAERVSAIAKHCSQTERKAQEAEFDAVDLKKLEYLKELLTKKQHQKFTGVIQTIMPHGFFVQINDLLIDGFVPASSLTDDFYNADLKKTKLLGRRSGKCFKLGQVVQVTPTKIDLFKRQVDFKI